MHLYLQIPGWKFLLDFRIFLARENTGWKFWRLLENGKVLKPSSKTLQHLQLYSNVAPQTPVKTKFLNKLMLLSLTQSPSMPAVLHLLHNCHQFFRPHCAANTKNFTHIISFNPPNKHVRHQRLGVT